MIIVSQDKEQITESLELRINPNIIEKGIFPNIGTEIDGCYIVDRKYNLCLGKYKTEERAKEVLQEIYKVYSDFSLIKCVNQKYQELLIANNKNEYFDVYEMPTE